MTYYIAAGQVYSSNKVFNNGSIAENTCPICGETLVNGRCDVIYTYGYGWSVYNKATDSVYIVCDSCQQAWPMTVFPDVYEFGNVHGIPCYNEYHKTYTQCRYCYKRFEEGTEPKFMKQTGYCGEECMMNTGYYCPVCKSPLYPFGYGLSYANIVLADTQADIADYSSAMQQGMRITAEVENKSERLGEQVVQVYVQVEGTPNEVPNPKLAAFARVSVEAGEKKQVELFVDKMAFGVIDEQGERCFDGSGATVFVGFGQPDQRTQELTGQSCKQIKIMK